MMVNSLLFLIMFLTQVVLGTTWVFCWWTMTGPGMILGSLRNWYLARTGKVWVWLQKPLFECPMCMTSLHGVLVFVTVNLILHVKGYEALNWWLFPFYCLSLCGFVTVIFSHMQQGNKDESNGTEE